jgi:c-di-GMP-related signal transduction protein
MKVYVARQPIFNIKKEIYAYELLFRDSMSNIFPEIDGDEATSKLLSSSFMSMEMGRLLGNKNAFINFPRDLLLQKTPTLFPRDKITVEILEDVEPEDDVVEACREIFQMGYDIALDDFVFRPELLPLIKIARIIKIDFKSMPLDQVKHLVEKLSDFKGALLAEKIETYAEFEEAVNLGFTYFQGYFFSKPEILTGREILPSQSRLLMVVAEVNRQEVSFDAVEKHILSDVSMSYKLLCYINSAYLNRVNEITSIRQALTLLGEREIRRFISLIVISELASEKPDELVRISIIRARFCELLGQAGGEDVDVSEFFIMGLFSLMDAMLDSSMESILENLPLPERVKTALTGGHGILSPYLTLVKNWERGSWKEVKQLALDIGVGSDSIPAFYLDAVEWAGSYSGA